VLQLPHPLLLPLLLLQALLGAVGPRPPSEQSG